MDFRALARRAGPGAGVLLAFGASLAGCLAGPYAASSGPADTLVATEGTSTTSSTGPDTTGTTTSSSSGVTDDSANTTAPPDSDTDTTTGAPARCGDGVVDDGEECDDGNAADDDDCLSTCVAATCGDGVVHLGIEECDDGNTSDLDGCSNECVAQVCGDGVVQPGEACDDGDADDTDECPGTCQAATCGDGFVWSGVEVCDARTDDPLCDADCTLPECGDGHTNAAAGEECDDGGATASCDADCTLPVCGDGDLSPLAGEECDDGNDLPGDGCSPACLKEQRVVFVTSALYTGNLGGLAGADAKCQQHAQGAGLSGVFLAWLSDDQHSPKSRFVKSTVPYVLPDGQQVAKNWNDLTDNVLQHAIDQTELKGPPPAAAATCSGKPTVWTNTREDGSQWESGVCGNFTNTTGAGRLGTSAAINYTWSRACSGAAGTCAWKAPLYCFEQ